MLRYILAIVMLSWAAHLQAAAEVSPNAVDAQELDGAVYQLTLSSKSHLPTAAAGLKPGTTIDFENGKILFDSGDGGVAKIPFSAEMISDQVLKITSTMGGELPRAQQLSSNKALTYVSVTITISGTITNSGKSFNGTLTWDEHDDRGHNKVEFVASGMAPKN